MNPAPRGILFDFDGTLGKTMEDNFEAWKSALADFGATLMAEEYFPLEGVALKELAKMYCAQKNIPVEHSEEIVKRKENYYLERHVFSFYPSVEEFISMLKVHEVPMAIVTTGLIGRISKSVPAVFLEKFNAVVTGDKTARGKPFPDPYLKGAEEIGVPIAECIVVENAPAGIQAAKSAGAYCIAICSTLGPELLKSADEIVSAFTDLGKTKGIRSLLE